MKFTLINNVKKNPFFKLVLTFLTLFFALFLLFDALSAMEQFGFYPSEIIATLQGDEMAFVEPILLDTLLIHIHQSLFFTTILLALLLIIYVRVSPYPKHRYIHLLFITALSSPMALLLSYYMATAVYLYLLCYYVWHGVALYLIGVIQWRLHR